MYGLHPRLSLSNRPGTPPDPWEPMDLGSGVLKAWFDFSDTATITDAGGGAVSQVTDKSGFAQTVTQATAGSRPTTGANSLNGKNVLTFDGGDELARTASITLPSSDPGLSIFCLRKITAGTTAGLVWITEQGASFGDNAALTRDGGNMGAGGNGINATPTAYASFADADNTGWHLNTAHYTEAARTIYEDALLKNTNLVAVNNSTNAQGAPTGIFIGHSLSRDRLTNLFITGQIAMVFVLAPTTVDNVQKLEGWIMWNYGLQGQLPVGFPYKNAPP